MQTPGHTPRDAELVGLGGALEFTFVTSILGNSEIGGWSTGHILETLQGAFGLQQVVFTQSSTLNITDILESCQEDVVTTAGLIWHLMGLLPLGRPFLGPSLDPAMARIISGPVSLVAKTLVSGLWLLSPALTHISVWKP